VGGFFGSGGTVKVVGRFSSSSTAVVAEATAAEEPEELDEELLVVVVELVFELDEPHAASANGTRTTANTNASPRGLEPPFLPAGRAARPPECPSPGTSFVSGI